MNILALDLGTKCGWATEVNDVPFSGTWKLATSIEIAHMYKDAQARNQDIRAARLFHQLRRVHRWFPRGLDVIYFEDVLFQTYTYQTQLWASLRAIIWCFASLLNIRTRCLNTASLKKFATGQGNAQKGLMASMLRKKYPTKFSWTSKPSATCYLLDGHGQKVDDNEVDALHLLDYAKQQHS